MSERKPSRIRQFFGFLFLRLIPLLLLLAVVLVGVNVAGHVVRYVSAQQMIDARRDAYRQTATALATPAASAAREKVEPLYDRLPEQVEQVFATNTPNPMSDVVIPSVNTAVPSTTPTASPSATASPTTPPTATPIVTSTPRPVPTLLMPGNLEPRAAAPTAIPTQVSVVDRRGQDILNILLLGNDGELTDDGFIRTDTMILVSVNRTAGTVGMLSLPRDLYVYMPGWTMNRLNVAYTYGESAGWTDGGFGLLRETLFYNFGINVHYYAMVDLSSFIEVIDAVGGIDIAVECAIQDLPLIGAEVPAGAFLSDEENNLYTLPVGYYHMSGAEALWYARSRGNSSDFDRGRRQQQVLRALWRAARDSGQLELLPDLWNQGVQMVDTNVPFDEMVALLPIALNLDPMRMEQLTFRLTYDTTPWQTPDGQNVQLPVYDHILELLNDLYYPPTENQIVTEGVTVAVFNGTSTDGMDRIVAEGLNWAGFSAVAAGEADATTYTDTLLIDNVGSSKGSRINDIARELSIPPANIEIAPDPNRTYDYQVIIGSSHNTCTRSGVLPVEPPVTPEG